jgi:hypothetical protein
MLTRSEATKDICQERIYGQPDRGEERSCGGSFSQLKIVVSILLSAQPYSRNMDVIPPSQAVATRERMLKISSSGNDSSEMGCVIEYVDSAGIG